MLKIKFTKFSTFMLISLLVSFLLNSPKVEAFNVNELRLNDTETELEYNHFENGGKLEISGNFYKDDDLKTYNLGKSGNIDIKKPNGLKVDSGLKSIRKGNVSSRTKNFRFWVEKDENSNVVIKPGKYSIEIKIFDGSESLSEGETKDLEAEFKFIILNEDGSKPKSVSMNENDKSKPESDSEKDYSKNSEKSSEDEDKTDSSQKNNPHESSEDTGDSKKDNHSSNQVQESGDNSEENKNKSEEFSQDNTKKDDNEQGGANSESDTSENESAVSEGGEDKSDKHKTEESEVESDTSKDEESENNSIDSENPTVDGEDNQKKSENNNQPKPAEGEKQNNESDTVESKEEVKVELVEKVDKEPVKNLSTDFSVPLEIDQVRRLSKVNRTNNPRINIGKSKNIYHSRSDKLKSYSNSSDNRNQSTKNKDKYSGETIKLVPVDNYPDKVDYRDGDDIYKLKSDQDNKQAVEATKDGWSIFGINWSWWVGSITTLLIGFGTLRQFKK